MARTWKDVAMRNLIRLRKTGGLVSLGLLTVNQALLIAQTVAWRGFNPWIVVPSVAFLLFTLAIAISYAVWILGDGYHAETAAQVAHNPTQTYAYNPFQQVEHKQLRIPKLRAIAAIAEDHDPEAAAELREAIDRWERWVDLGYIPRDEYPEHLLHHYLSDGGRL